MEWRENDAFGIQIKADNQYNTNLAESASSPRENDCGVTNVIIEDSETLLNWAAGSGGNEPSFKFTLLQELDGATWVCIQGNWGGWTRRRLTRRLPRAERSPRSSATWVLGGTGVAALYGENPPRVTLMQPLSESVFCGGWVRYARTRVDRFERTGPARA